MSEPRFDFITVKRKEGADPAAIEAALVALLGAAPDKARPIVADVSQKGPVSVEKAVTAQRVEELKAKCEAAGLVTRSKSVLALMAGMAAEPGKPVFKCPACGHEQDPQPHDQCSKCG